MSIFALCAEMVSCTRISNAVALISWSRPLLFGYTDTDTAVIFPFPTVICTWTAPHLVSVESPRNVPLAAAAAVVGASDSVVALDVSPLSASPAVADGSVIPDALVAEAAVLDAPARTGATTELSPATAREDVDVW